MNHQKTPLKVAWVNQGHAVPEDSWTMAHARAAEAVAAAFGTEVDLTWVEDVDVHDGAARVVDDLVLAGNQLIFATSMSFSAQMTLAARRHPSVKFEQARGAEVLDNLATFANPHEDTTFLVGMLAGALLGPGRIGYLGTVPGPETFRHLTSFTLGAQSTAPGVTVEVAWLNAWRDPANERRLADDLVSRGAGLLATGCTGAAVGEAARAAGLRWCGHEADHANDFPTEWLTASVPDWSRYYLERVRAALDGTWRAAAYYGSLADGYTDLAPFGTGVPDDIRARILTAKRAITTGELQVLTGPIRDQHGTVRVPANEVMTVEQRQHLDWLAEGIVGESVGDPPTRDTGSRMVDSPVLLDPALDRLLRRDGFVTFPLVSAEHAAALRAEYGDLRGWDMTGFQSDLFIEEPHLRRQTAKVISASLDQVLIARFNGYQPFLRTFQAKYPGEDSGLQLHQDWMCVDERCGARSYVAWVALEDITGHNGQLRVLRGSHLLDGSVRGTNLTAPWLQHTDVIEPRLLSVPVKAGEVIVFDTALVHASFPNHTGVPRLAAAVAMAPADEPLVHLRRIDDDRAALFHVDEDFLRTATPQALFEGPPDRPVSEIVSAAQLALSPEDLAQRLDVGRHNRVDRLQQATTRASMSTAAALRSLPARLALAERWPRAGEALRRLQAHLPPSKRLTRSDLHDTLERLRTKAAIAVLGCNEAVINRFGPSHPAVWDVSEFAWSAPLEERWMDIRAEVDALLAGPAEIPHIQDVAGGIPQGNVGVWRTFVLRSHGTWIDANCDRCPRTVELVKEIPGLTLAGFSVLEPGTHITKHRGPNKGALRYQLGIIVPGRDGDCRIQVGDEMLIWREGEGVAFDFTVEHEAWNDTDEVRVLLMLEFLTPLPRALAISNRLAQRAMGWFPTTRGMAQRLRQLELDSTGPTS